jgi:hypothetical protein
MADSRVDAYLEMAEAMIEFFRFGGNQGEVHGAIEDAYIEYRTRRAIEAKAERGKPNESEKL